MTTIEVLLQIASGQGEVFDQMRDMIGQGELALLIVTTALKGTSVALSPTRIAEVLKMTSRGAAKKAENTVVKSDSSPNDS